MKCIYLIVFAFLCSFQLADARIIYVKSSGSGTGSSWATAAGNLKNVLDTATTGDTIWVAQGTYYPSADNNEDTSFYLKNNVAVYGGFDGSETSLSARADVTGKLTTLSGDLGKGYRSKHVVYGPGSLDSTARLDGFTIADGLLEVDTVFGGGAGMYNEGSPLLANIIFENDTLNLVAAHGVSLIGGGGGLCNKGGNPQLINVSFLNNAVNLSGSGSGYIAGMGGGGALYTDSGDVQMTNMTFIGNVVSATGKATGFGGGGAVFVDYSKSHVNITNALFVKNYGYPTNQTFGSGIYGFGGNVKVTNATFSANSFYPIYALFDSILILNCILDYTIYNYYATLVINNSFLGYGVTGSSAPYYTGSDNISTFSAPQFVDTARGNYTMIPCSNTINAGNDTFNRTSTDLAGKPRKYGTIDMGAYEYQRASTMPDTIYVNAAATDPYPNGASWGDAFADLAEALNLNCSGTHARQIWVAKGTYHPSSTGDRGAVFVVYNNMAVYGGFAGTETSLSARDSTGKTNVTILSGELQNDSDITNNSVHLIYANTDSSSQLNGFTITGGYAGGLGSATDNTFGGGIFNAAGNTVYANLIIENSKATFGGGGMANFDGSPTLRNVKFINDAASGIGGGGLYTDGSGLFISPGLTSYANPNTPVLINDSFVNCYHSFGGGGIFASTCAIKTDNVVFVKNAASYYGGAIMGDNSSLLLTHTKFIRNTTVDTGAGARGGALYDDAIDTSTVLMNDVLFANNEGGPGGAAYLDMIGNVPILNNVTFCNNRNITYDTIYGKGGNAIYLQGPTTLYGTPNRAKLWNCIIDSAGNGNSDLGGDLSATSVMNCLFEGSFPADAKDSGGNLVHKDPLFVDTATGDYRLKICSPAINAGNDTVLDTTITTDLAGQPRRYNGSIVDIGAYEYQGKVAPLPTAAITAAARAFCYGDSSLLMANKDSGLHYQWQLNDTDIAADTASAIYAHAAGRYKVITTNADGCTATSAADTEIVHPLPKPIITATLTTLSTTTYVSYQWYRNGSPIAGATKTAYNYTQKGYYTVYVTDSNGCGGMSDSELVTVTGINNLAAQNTITIYPNPATSVLHIASPVTVNAVITDMEGRILLQKEHAADMNINSLPDGIYMVKITDTEGKLLKMDKLLKTSN